MRILTSLVCLCAVCGAGTITVDINGGSDYTEIQPAVDAAADGDTVLVKPGEYVIIEPIDFNRLHDPDDPASPSVKNIILRSEGGAEVTTIRWALLDESDRTVMYCARGETTLSVVEGFTTLNGHVRCRLGSSPTLASCTISKGGVHCWSSSPTLRNCLISESSSSGVSCLRASFVLKNCTIVGSLEHGVSSDGFPDSKPSIVNCIIWDCAGDSVHVGNGTWQPDVRFSCFEGEEVWP